MRLLAALATGAALLSAVITPTLSSQARPEGTPFRRSPESSAQESGTQEPGAQESNAQELNAQESGAYQQGLELKSRGRWEEALELWLAASDSFAAPADPRIALAYLETVLENEAEPRYHMACGIFLWGLSGSEYASHLRKPILDELERVIPLMEEDEAEPWTALRDSSTEKIAWELKHFWIEKDPTPTTILNERLIEHWQRILFARSQFTYSLDSPYGTDDRGVIWVKFGPPDRERTGMLGASEMELKIRIPFDIQARDALRRYDTNPQYEIWVYDDLNDQGFTYFLFGNEGGQGRFRLVDGVRDLIPQASRSRTSSRYTPGGVPAAYYLELFYYETLSDVGGRFGRRFAELNELWNQYTTRTNWEGGRSVSPSENTLRSFSQRYDMWDRNDPENPPREPTYSSFEGQPRDEMVVQTVRVLRDNRPRLFLLAMSASRLQVPDDSGLRRQRLVAPGSTIRHTLIVRNENLSEVGRLTQQLSDDGGDVSIFQLRHPELPMHLTVVGETLLTGDSTAPRAVKVGFEEGRALPAHTHIEPQPPLSTDTAHLEVSDLTLGVQIPETVDGSELPFPLLPAPRIWLGDAVRVYLEVYHLGLDGNGAGRFRGDFRVQPLKDDGTVDPARPPVTLGVELETDGPMFAAPFDIALRDQELGHYRVEVTITDLMRNETVTRFATLELIE